MCCGCAHLSRYRKVDSEYWKSAVSNAIDNKRAQIQELWKLAREGGGDAPHIQIELTVLLKDLLVELMDMRYPGKIEGINRSAN